MLAESHLPGYEAVLFVKSHRCFGRTSYPHLQGKEYAKEKSNVNQVVFFDSEDGGDMFLRNIG
jgi:hypothetical protein